MDAEPAEPTEPPAAADRRAGRARRLARSARARLARETRTVVEAAMAPTSEALRARIAELEERVGAVGAGHDALSAEQAAVAKDLLGLHQWVDDHAATLDPASGGHELVRRLLELTDDVRNLDRRTRELTRSRGTTTEPAVPDGPSTGPADRRPERDVPLDDLVDYDAFERRFRGDPADITAAQVERYGPLLDGRSPIVDVGCGRGGFLAALQTAGAEVVGVEPNGDLAAHARAQGLAIHELDAGRFLRHADDASFGAIVSFQVVEHLRFADLIEFLDLAVQKLRSGGLFLAETPNPASWIVMHTSFILDPTHVWPLHPGLLSFLCERAGFADVRVVYHSPAETMHLPVLDDAERPQWSAPINQAFDQLNHVMFGPQDYAVVARAPSARAPS